MEPGVPPPPGYQQAFNACLAQLRPARMRTSGLRGAGRRRGEAGGRGKERARLCPGGWKGIIAAASPRSSTSWSPYLFLWSPYFILQDTFRKAERAFETQGGRGDMEGERKFIIVIITHGFPLINFLYMGLFRQKRR